MSFAPASIQAAADYYVAQGGVNLGIVGDTAHQSRSSYHNGKDVILAHGWWDSDYSVHLPRDRCCATKAASAFDLGKLDGSYTGLRKLSNWLVDQCQKDRDGFAHDIREIIWSPDGVYVKRWSGPDNKVYTSLKKNADGSITVITPGNGDATHFAHTHMSFYRDSEHRSKVGLFKPYFEPPEGNVAGLRYTLDATGDLSPEQRIATQGTAKIVGTGHDLINPALRMADITNVVDGFNLGRVQTGIARETAAGITSGEKIVVYNAGAIPTVHISPLRDVAFVADQPPKHSVQLVVDGTMRATVSV
jgi:hypothetical protein